MLFASLVDHPTFSICIFCIPEGGCIPLHDHPGMSVSSKLIAGDLSVRSFDFAGGGSGPDGRRRAMPVANDVIEGGLPGAGSITTLYSSHGGNAHEFIALSDCVILDVLAPPYAPGGGRDCTYYVVEEEEQKEEEEVGRSDSASGAGASAPASAAGVLVDVDVEAEERGRAARVTYLRACPEPGWFYCDKFAEGFSPPSIIAAGV